MMPNLSFNHSNSVHRMHVPLFLPFLIIIPVLFIKGIYISYQSGIRASKKPPKPKCNPISQFRLGNVVASLSGISSTPSLSLRPRRSFTIPIFGRKCPRTTRSPPHCCCIVPLSPKCQIPSSRDCLPYSLSSPGLDGALEPGDEARENDDDDDDADGEEGKS